MRGALGRCRSRALTLAVALGAVGVWLTDAVGATPSQRQSDNARSAAALSRQQSLASGVLLVASRRLADPNFAESVVLLFAYSKKDGAAGLIVNRRTTVRARQLLPDLPPFRPPEPFLFLGGPVARDSVRGLVRSPVAGVGVRVLPDVAMVGTSAALEAVADEVTADDLRLYGGYAGWGPQQLEREVERGDWFITRGDSKIIFASDPGAIWRTQIRLLDVITLQV
jgi:putative transcriptional regulator